MSNELTSGIPSGGGVIKTLPPDNQSRHSGNLFESIPFSVIIFALIGLYIFNAIIHAFRQGTLKQVRVGTFRLLGSIARQDVIVKEEQQLANYYSQVLNQSKISFWFSLVFASIGFIVILITAFMQTGIKTVPGFIAGMIIDTVSALFFVQSKNAQKSMAEYFEKLRDDKKHGEVKSYCSDLTQESAKDAVKVQLCLFYAGITQHNEIAERIIRENISRKEP